MDFKDVVINRRSIRKYKNQSISDETLDSILKTAMYAPSAMNLQAWHFIVIDSKEILVQTIKSIAHAELLRQSDKAIIVCGDASVEKNESWMIQNCSASIQNILLAAHDAGLGACWIAIHGMNEVVKNVKEQFTLPEAIVPVALISLGYPDEVVNTEDRFKKEKIHYNKW
ncbi:MAG: nitroreductase family protein [Ignavibacteriales bacterium]|nr:MAG: nitroreductase family protein [Ignavibacteriales bacterium]